MRFPGTVACMTLATLVISAQQKPASPTGPFDPAGIVISEILFDPRPGDSAFVELLNTTNAALDLSRLAVRSGDVELSLIRVTERLAAGGRLLVKFDGQGKVEAATLHAPGQIDLDRHTGRVALVNGVAEEMDAVAWGDEDGAVDVNDGFDAVPPRGRTIGRPPGANHPLDLTQWIVYGPAEATPGAENPLPHVTDLLPDGEILAGSKIELAWYGVVGAASYRVQMSRDDTFSALLLDSTVSSTRTTSPTVASGAYVWRVQPLDARNRPGQFSAPARVQVYGTATAETRAVRSTVPAFSIRPTSRIVQGPLPSLGVAVSAPSRVLSVPFLWQHKDTAMLQLENDKEKDPHGWDRNHQVLDPSDPADNTNCVPASIAMVNHFYGGDESQDRIAFEVKSRRGAQYASLINGAPNRIGLPAIYPASRIVSDLKEKAQGPEWDLSYGDALTNGQLLAAMTFALGGLPQYHRYFTHADMWSAITAEIDAGRPLLIKRNKHVVVIVGYGMYLGQEVFVAHDPLRGTVTRALRLNPSADYGVFFTTPTPRGVRQEVELRMDTDGDGVVDFDETERFHTDPKNMDTDGDGVRDKEDIASGVFDPTYGYARHNTSTRGRDFDADTKPTELDRDSDDGGCNDGVEDLDADGHRAGRESWNFLDTDDICNDVNGRIVFAEYWRAKSTDGGMRFFRDSTINVTVKLKPETPGQMGPLVDNGSLYRFRFVAVLEVPAIEVNGCHPIARGTGGGHGRFDHVGADIGGNFDQDSIVIGAGGDGTEHNQVDMCTFGGSNHGDTSMGLPSCEGKREITAGISYKFDCTTPGDIPPNIGIDFDIALWSVTGRVTVVPPAPQSLATTLFRRADWRKR